MCYKIYIELKTKEEAKGIMIAVTLVAVYIYIYRYFYKNNIGLKVTKNVTLLFVPCQNKKCIKRLMLGENLTH